MRSSHHLFILFLLTFTTACQQVDETAFESLPATTATGQDNGNAATANIVFKSIDGGFTWQDISAGLPSDTKAEGLFVGEGELLLTTKEDIYRTSTASKSANWEKEMFLKRPLVSVSATSAGVIAIANNRQFFQKLKGKDVWMPIFTDFKDAFMRNVFIAKDGSTFVASDNGIFKSKDGGKTWKHVMQDGWVIKMKEWNGVLLCTSQQGILRSTDGGEHWDVGLSEGGVGIDLVNIKDGFAAITYNTETKTRRIRTSTDGGKTWQPIDAGLPPSSLVSSILQMGNDFYCGHPDGIFRSADQGKSWQLVVPATEKKGFNLSMYNGVIYAYLREGGC